MTLEGDKMSGETAHRDVARFKLPEDEIFGGWLKLGTSADGVTLGSMAGRLEFGGVMWYPQNIWVNGLKQLEEHHETHR